MNSISAANSQNAGMGAVAQSGGAALERLEGLEFQSQQTNQNSQTNKDQKTQFGDVWNQIQTRYGKKPEKPREIKKTLGKDDFMNLMINQMKNQDPTKPFDAEQMASQLAQFASVEQLTNVNQAINKMAANNRPLEQMTMTHMIGKQVTVDRNRIIHTENESTPIAFNLPERAKKIKVTVLSELGEPVFVKEMNDTDAGSHTISWDGKKPNSLPAKTGHYMVRIEATGVDNRPLNMDSRVKANVVGVAFEGSEPVLLIGDASYQEKIPLKNIIQIEESFGGNGAVRNPMNRMPPSTSAPVAIPQSVSPEVSATEQVEPNPLDAETSTEQVQGSIQPLNQTQSRSSNNFFAFTPGQGSHGVDPDQEQSLLQKTLQKGGEPQ